LLFFCGSNSVTKKGFSHAHQHDVTVEAELGVLAGVEDEVQAEESHSTPSRKK
jgi:fructose-bisphosphate aldolase class II